MSPETDNWCEIEKASKPHMEKKGWDRGKREEGVDHGWKNSRTIFFYLFF